MEMAGVFLVRGDGVVARQRGQKDDAVCRVKVYVSWLAGAATNQSCDDS